MEDEARPTSVSGAKNDLIFIRMRVSGCRGPSERHPIITFGEGVDRTGPHSFI
jgi:hypothetical protein